MRVVGLEWRDELPDRTGDVEAGDGFGPGLVFVIDNETWEEFNQRFGDDADYRHQGYRYHRRRVTVDVLVRLTAGRPPARRGPEGWRLRRVQPLPECSDTPVVGSAA